MKYQVEELCVGIFRPVGELYFFNCLRADCFCETMQMHFQYVTTIINSIGGPRFFMLDYLERPAIRQTLFSEPYNHCCLYMLNF